jgi:superfamily II DNA or RNA helicase
VSSLRFSIGHAIAPIRRAKIAAARNPRLSPCPILQYPPITQISRRSDSESRLFYTRLDVVMNFDASPEGLEQPRIIDTPVRLQIPGSVDQILDGFKTGELLDISLFDLDEQTAPGPPPLTRYSPVINAEGKVSAELPGINLLRPFLEIPLLTSEIESSLVPVSLSEHQVKASKALFDRRALLLADDPGTGKKAAICVALNNLFQQGEVERALILCPEWAGRQWLGALHNWAPSIASIFVKGERECREVGWYNRAHVYLTDYQTFAEDVENNLLAVGELVFNLLVLDGINSIRHQTRQITTALKLVHADKRWALAGSLPTDPEGWLNIFGLLTPERVGDAIGLRLPDIEKRFFPFMLRRSKADLAEELPRLTRHEVWLDLDPRQAQAYQEALREERDRLSKLGEAVTQTHVMTAIDRLKKTSNFALDWLDGVKVRALVDLIEDLSSSEAKIVVFSQYREEGLGQLRPALEAYGVLNIYKETSESERSKVLEAFRKDAQWHVLLMEMGARIDDEPLPEATYILHFDHNWNPAIRRRAELRLNPSLSPSPPLNIYEFWVADTIDEKIYALLAERGLLPRLLPDDTQPDEIEEKLTLDDWLKEVLEVPPPPEPVLGLTMPISPEVQPPLEEPIEEDVISLPVEVEVEDIMTPEVQPPSFEPVEGDILLHPTDVEGEEIIAAEEQPPTVEIAEEDVLPLPVEPEEEDIETPEAQPPPVEARERGLSTLPLEALIEGVDLLMRDQGYPDLEVIEELEEGCGEWIAHRVRDDEIESVYVRFYRMERNVDIRKARAVLKAFETHSDCQLAYLVTTSDFSRSCKKLAKESEGKLVLITGDELSEYVHFEHFDAAGSYDGAGE